MKRINWYLLLVTCCCSCKKFIAVDPPENQMTAGAVFSNDSTARAAVTGMYIKIMGNNQFLLNGGLSVYSSLSADELKRVTFRSDDDQFIRNALLPDNKIIATNFWKPGYAYIYLANICLEGLSKSAGVTPAVKNQLMGEAKFIRALSYWYLVNTFGDVPLVTSTNVDVNMLLPRSPADQIYKTIVADLRDAVTVLADTHVNTRPHKMAAAALLARVYCYLKDWAAAETFSTMVLDAGRYHLATDVNQVFVAGSPETIFQLAPVLPNNSSAEGYSFVPASAMVPPAYILTSYLLSAFEPGDQRRINWVKSTTVNGQTYYYPYKYKINTIQPPATEFNVVLRTAEQHLIRAEARVHLNSIENAATDLNVIRSRAGLSPLPTDMSVEACIAAIEQERRIELFAEWGHRWLDLKRTNRIDQVLGVVKGSDWLPTDQLYPIPLSEIQKDPNLVQNHGY